MSCRSRLYRRTSSPCLVELGPDAVVLVLDPDRRPQPRQDLGRVLGRRGEHELERMEERQAGVRGGPSRASVAVRPMSPVSIPAHLTSASGRSNAFAIAASRRPSRSPIRSSPLRTLTMDARRQRVRAREQVAQRRLARRPRRLLDRRTRRRLGQRRRDLGVRRGRPRQHVGHRGAQVRRAVVGLAQADCRYPGEVRRRRPDRRPAEAGGPLVGLRERPPGEEDGRGRAARRREEP